MGLAGKGAAALTARLPRTRAPLFAWLMALPAVAALLAVTVYPLVYSLRESFYRLELTFSPIPHYVGFGNYVHPVEASPRLWDALGRSADVVLLRVTRELLL